MDGEALRKRCLSWVYDRLVLAPDLPGIPIQDIAAASACS